jgi:tetratricopeptide (TPR) repeat protein
MDGKLFLSHSSADKAEAQALRRALEDSGVAVWEDVLELRAGDRLGDLEQVVKGARGLLLLWTPAARESEWVGREAGWAREAQGANPDYRLLVLPRGTGRVSVRRLLGEELIFIESDGAVADAVPAIRRALGERAASGRTEAEPAPPPLLEELVISFTDARIEESGGRRRAAGRFRLHHRPAVGSGSRSSEQEFESPLGSIELEEIRWYLERYPGWPFGTFRDRARKLEASLPEWGRELYRRTLATAAETTAAWRRAEGSARRVVVEVEDAGPVAGDDGGSSGSAAALLALPWELLADDEGYLFEGGLGARVVRRIPRRESRPPLPVADRLRVLLVIARPEEEGVAFLDPRASARPLIEALAPLGHRAELEVLADGTFPALREALARAEKAGSPFHVVHFDGHGVYDPHLGLGELCFENPADAAANKPERRAELIDAEKLGGLLRQRRVPVFVLEACQTAMADQEVRASVAARLLQAGVGSVLAMTHAVLVETARRFTDRFYQALAAGERIGSAMVAAEHHLRDDPTRGKAGGHGALTLQDWFVPVLFQEEEGDLQLLTAGAAAPEDLAAERQVREGELPPPPAHGFVGRARELLAVSRRLRDDRVLAVLGEGGQGKTALAVECARWLLDLRHAERLAFASVEDLPGARLLLERLGRQLVPGYSVAKEEGTGTSDEQLRRARLPVERVLAERRVLLVVDNLESILPAPGKGAPAAADPGEVLALLADLAAAGDTRLLVTSREAPPAPLQSPTLRLGPLGREEGRELVAGVLARADRAPAGDADEAAIDALVEQVGGHARSLVLLAPLVAEQGLKITKEAVAKKMADLEKLHPGDRENSLLASVRLSLDRLPQPARTQVRALAVFHSAAHVKALARVLEVEPGEALALCRRLVDLGLADATGPFLLPDPALGLAVADELSADERRGMDERWLAATLQLIGFLYEEHFRDTRVAVHGTQTALADLVAAVERSEAQVMDGGLSAEFAMGGVVRLLQLASVLGRPALLAKLGEMRRRFEACLGEWSHGGFTSARAEVEARLAAGEVTAAVEAAARLKEQAQGGENAYPAAAYDRAVAFALLGQALRLAGRGEEALPPLEEAEKSLTELARRGDKAAAQTLASVIHERGGALRDLGRLEEAGAAHLRSTEIAEATGNLRSAAVGRAQLATVRLLQGRLQEALEEFENALRTFEVLLEPKMVAVSWHQIGLVHEEAGHWDMAEASYQQSLRIEVELRDKAGQASTLNQLGLLYLRSGRREEAAGLLQQAATLRHELGDTFKEARSLGNLSLALLNLGRLDEAREAASRADELQVPFGHAAEPWKIWDVLRVIEAAAGRPEKAGAARARANELYAAYRRDGGEPQSPTGRLILTVGQALQQRGAPAARCLIPPTERFDNSTLPVRDALLAIIDGARDAAFAQDPRFHCHDAVELTLLIESLSSSPP